MAQMHLDQWDDVPEGQIEEELEAQLDSNVLYASMADIELVLLSNDYCRNCKKYGASNSSL